MRNPRASSLALASFLSSSVNAQTQVDSSDFGVGPTVVFLGNITRAVPELLTQIVESPAYQSITLSIFLFSATIALVLALKKYIWGGTQLDLAEVVLRVSIVWVLMESYLVLMWVGYEWQDDFGSMVQFAILGTTNKYTALDTVFSLYDRFEFNIFNTDFGWNVGKLLATLFSDIAYLFFVTGFYIILLALLILTSIVSIFALWGFLIVGAIGFMMLPLLLFPPLTFVFEGWLRTMLTVLLYSVIARFVLSISAWGFDLLLGAPDSTGMQSVIVITGRDWESLLGCIMWAAVSIAAMQSVMSYSQSIVSGVGAAMADARMSAKATQMPSR